MHNWLQPSGDLFVHHRFLPLIRRACATIISIACAQPAAAQSPPCPPDLDGNRFVDGSDIGLVLLEFGACVGCAADLDGNEVVDAADIALLLLDFGPCPSWYSVIRQQPDPTVVHDAGLRAAILATGLPWHVIDTRTGMEMLLVPPGSFVMGCSPSNAYACLPNETPRHAVTLTNAFYLGRYEVTQAQWLTAMGSNPAYHQGFVDSMNRPVEQVTWDRIQQFCAETGLRLPTEAEWEYAYRAGTDTALHSMPGFPDGTNDDTQLGQIAWMTYNSGGQTRPVGGRAPNRFGFHDMSGNVWEWVQDRYDDSYYSVSPSVNPPGPSHGSMRVMRGGAWYYNFYLESRSSYRYFGSPSSMSDRLLGFRAVRNP
jgi:formylglycine-generating enzyme required for sulfatase activity